MAGKKKITTRAKKVFRLLLWEQQKGKCFYCGVDTILPETGERNVIADNTATYEHVYSRNHPRAQALTADEYNRHAVMACYACNHNKSLLEARFRVEVKGGDTMAAKKKGKGSKMSGKKGC
jgi:hypothetical protein